jgi:hypothetical protein
MHTSQSLLFTDNACGAAQCWCVPYLGAMSAPASKVSAGSGALADAVGAIDGPLSGVGEVKNTYDSVIFSENVTFTGGYLKQPAVVAVHRQSGQMFVLMDHSDWVCKAVCGCSRARNPLKSEKTLTVIRGHAVKLLQVASASSALAEDPMLALESDVSLVVGDITPVKRLRRTVQSGVLSLPACDIAPPGYTGFLPFAVQVYVQSRRHTCPAIYVLDSDVQYVLLFLRHEIQ